MTPRRIVLLAGLIGVASPAIVAAQQTETIEYYQADLVGSIRIVYGAGGNVIARQDYTPFGTPVLNGTSMPTEGFVENEKDDETQQMNFHARSLSMRMGRFTSRDPLGGDSTQPQTFNAYAYAADNPLRFSDVTGLAVSQDLCFSVYGNTWSQIICPTETIDLGGGGVITTPHCWDPDCVGHGGRSGPGNRPGNGTGNGNGNGNGEDNNNSGSDKKDQGKKDQATCQAKMKTMIDVTLHTQSIPLGPTTGDGLDKDGYRNGAYNVNFFLPGVANALAGSSVDAFGRQTGRFPNGLHIVKPGGPDPTIRNWGPGDYNGMFGSFATVHIDSSDPYEDVRSFVIHVWVDVIQQTNHGC